MSKLWPDAVIQDAPPMEERPRCLYCGQRLRPNYDTKHEYREVTLTAKEATERNEKEPWRLEPWEEGDTYSGYGLCRRVWLGTYGMKDRWCGITHAGYWARDVAPELEKRGEVWKCAKARQAEKE